jgi:thiol-disulfide isomerase/thioredoxin
MAQCRSILATGILFGLAVFTVGGPMSRVLAADDREPRRPGVTIGSRVALDPRVRRSLGKTATVVVFLGVGCPVSNAYVPHLNELARKYEAKGVRFIGVNANDQDSAEDVARHAKEYTVTFPVLKDSRQRIADALGAERVPEVAVIDAAEQLRYRGRIDDRVGVISRKEKPTREDLAIALDELLAGKPIQVTQTEVSGCLIGRAERKPAQPITYANQVARIIQKKCQSCHRSDGVAPFALTTYDQTRAWAKTIKEVVVERRMPPWHADPHFGKFANDRSLSQQELNTLVAWVDGGTARGDDKDLPAPLEFPKGQWTIGQPDVVLSIPREFTVPAKGVLPYQEFEVETHFKEDRWIERAQVLPGSKAVHHAVVFIQSSNGPWLCAYVPGDSPLVLAPGTAKKIPAGARLRFNMHYTPTGKEEHDRTQLGLTFAKLPPRHEIRHYLVDKHDIRIPAGAANHREERDVAVPHDMKMVSLFPHMHTRGKSWECRVSYPDGKTETVLKVPRYDFNWQHTYRLAEPLVLPRGARFQCVAHYDNSKDNPANPDPTKEVKWGPQTWDEMFVCSIEYLVDRGSGPATPATPAVAAHRLPREQVVKAGSFLNGQAAKLDGLPIRADGDATKASLVTEGRRALLCLPDKRLAQEVVSGAGKEVVPIGQLWLRECALTTDGKSPARDTLREITVALGEQRQPLVLYLLGVRKNADGALELVIFAKDRDARLTVPLRDATVQQDLPIEFVVKPGETAATKLTLNLLGKYQAALAVTSQSP